MVQLLVLLLVLYIYIWFYSWSFSRFYSRSPVPTPGYTLGPTLGSTLGPTPVSTQGSTLGPTPGPLPVLFFSSGPTPGPTSAQVLLQILLLDLLLVGFLTREQWLIKYLFRRKQLCWFLQSKIRVMEKYFVQYIHPRWLQARAGFNAGAYSGIWPGGKVEKKGKVVMNGKVEKKGKVVRNGKEEIQFSVISFFPSSYLCQIENLILYFCKIKPQLKIFFFEIKTWIQNLFMIRQSFSLHTVVNQALQFLHIGYFDILRLHVHLRSF